MDNSKLPDVINGRGRLSSIKQLLATITINGGIDLWK
jgi:hypothetical protein